MLNKNNNKILKIQKREELELALKKRKAKAADADAARNDVLPEIHPPVAFVYQRPNVATIPNRISDLYPLT